MLFRSGVRDARVRGRTSLDALVLTAAAAFTRDAGFSAEARVEIGLGGSFWLDAGHRFGATASTSAIGLRMERELFDAGVALAYEWRARTLAAKLTAGADLGPVRVDASHAQPLVGGGDAVTTLGVSTEVAEATLSAGVRIERGEVRGEFGVSRAFGDVEVDIGYTLEPGERPDRLRFGVAVPIALTDAVGVDAFAAVVFSDPATEWRGGVVLRYRDARTDGEIGLDGVVRVGDLGVETTLHLRGGLAGAGDVVAYAADVDVRLLPELAGRFGGAVRVDLGGAGTVDATTLRPSGAIAYLDGDVREGMTTLTAGVGAQIDVVGAAHGPGEPVIALRPSVAFRVGIGSPVQPLAIQPRLGVALPFTVFERDVSVSAYGQALARPALGTIAYSAGAEVRFEIVDAVWLVVGYDGGESLLRPAGRGGFTFGIEGRALMRW